MTVTLIRCDPNNGMSLFQDLKLKRRKVDSRCSSDGESFTENASYSPDSGSSPNGDRNLSPKNAMNFMDSQSVDPKHEKGLSSPSQLEIVKEELDFLRSDNITTFYEEDENEVSSTPSGLGASGYVLDKKGTSPRDHLMGNNRRVDVQSTIHISPMFSDIQEGSSLGPGGIVHSPGANNMFSVKNEMNDLYNHPRVIPIANLNPIQNSFVNTTRRINNVEYIRTPGSSHAVNDSIKREIPKSKVTPTVVRGLGGIKTMYWASADSPPPATQRHSYCVDNSDALRASVDGLLSLGQEVVRSSSPLLITHTKSLSKTSSSSSSSPNYRYPPGSMMHTSSHQSHQIPYGGFPHPGPEKKHTMSPSTFTSLTPAMPETPRVSHGNLSMESFWRDRPKEMLPHPDSQAALNLSKETYWQDSENSEPMSNGTPMDVQDDEDRPLVCMVCEDRATGLHYGIFTCEGCKGFFKRTVQNKRIYSCGSDGNCVITKAQRNRCQYCRFNKCIAMGMVIAAVREDRMPGGRNSGAVYNLYKVKYKKKKNKNGQIRPRCDTPQAKSKLHSSFDALSVSSGNSLGASPVDHNSTPLPLPMPLPVPTSQLSSHMPSGNILKAALTNPSEVAHYRIKTENFVSTSTREPTKIPYSSVQNMIQSLIEVDDFEDLATLQDFDGLLESNSDGTPKLQELGDKIGLKLVKWIRGLPFYKELPIDLHTHLLTSKWQELLVLTTCTYQALYGSNKITSMHGDIDMRNEIKQRMASNAETIQACLTNITGRSFTIETLKTDMDRTIEKLSQVTFGLRKLSIQMEEYVCLKIITLLNQTKNEHRELDVIQERYIDCLRAFCENHFPSQPNRANEILVKINDISSAASLLLETKIFYAPFLMCSLIPR